MEKMLGSGENDEPLDAVGCANVNGEGGANCSSKCSSTGAVFCQHCRLVSYHSKECQMEHWKLHKALCKSDLMNESWGSTAGSPHISRGISDQQQQTCNRQFESRRPWDNLPAYGLLGDHVPAGQVLPQHLRVCFADVTDLRNVIETMCQIPDDFKGRAIFHVNASDRHAAVRNFIILELMRVFGEKAIDAVIAMWYSVALTEKQSEAVNEVVLQALRWESLDMQGWVLEGSEGPEGFGVHFNRQTMDVFQQMIYCSSLTAESARMYLKTVIGRLPDFADERLSCLRPAHRLACHRFNQTRVLLPFASQEAHHNKANLLLFFMLNPGCSRFSVPYEYPFDPLQQWDIKQVLASGVRHGVPAMDLYGCLFFHLRSKLQSFLDKWRRCHVMIFLSNTESSMLASSLRQRRLHRIDASCKSVEYNMRSLLRHWEPLLVTRRRPKNNVEPVSSRQCRGSAGAASHAASNEIEPLIITYCINWPGVYHKFKSMSSDDDDPISDVKTMLHPAITTSEEAGQALERANHWALTRQGYSEMAKKLCTQCVGAYFHDYSKAFDEYLSFNKFDLPVEPKEKNVALPHRLFVPVGAHSSDTPALRGNLHDFYICNALHYGCTMMERFAEWTKISS